MKEINKEVKDRVLAITDAYLKENNWAWGERQDKILNYVASFKEKMHKAKNYDYFWFLNSLLEKEIISYAEIVQESLFQEWSTGGYSGGNCWNDDEPEYYSNNEEPAKFVVLDKILEAKCPNISFLLFRKIENLIKISERTEFEYYGNSTDYKSRSLDLRELYNFLVQHKLVEGSS